MKKRYTFTLPIGVVEQIHVDLKRLGLTPAALSGVITDVLIGFSPVVTRLADKKEKGIQVTFEDVISETLLAAGEAMRP